LWIRHKKENLVGVSANGSNTKIRNHALIEFFDVNPMGFFPLI
jgi:hypothetical protein